MADIQKLRDHSSQTLSSRERVQINELIRRVNSAYWDDLRFPANGIAIGAFSNPPGVETDTGLLLFNGVATNETIAVLAQLSHSWKEESLLGPHLHWKKTTDAAGDVVWTFRYKWITFDELETAWSELETAIDVNVVDSTQKEIISFFPDIVTTGRSISDMLLIQLGRTPGVAGDTYTADALLYEFDIHFQKDYPGSLQPYIKQD